MNMMKDMNSNNNNLKLNKVHVVPYIKYSVVIKYLFADYIIYIYSFFSASNYLILGLSLYTISYFILICKKIFIKYGKTK
jgi:hypothetical protein